LICAVQLVDLCFDNRVRVFPRQHLDLVPCEASGGVVRRKKVARSRARLRYYAPLIVTKKVITPWASI
jgi:hypothetical protein